MSKTAEELKDTLNDIERDVYDGVDLGDMFTKAYVLADELGESIDKLRELAARAWGLFLKHGAVHPCDLPEVDAVRDELRELGVEVTE